MQTSTKEAAQTGVGWPEINHPGLYAYVEVLSPSVCGRVRLAANTI